MPLRGLGRTKRSFWTGSVVLILAIAAIGVSAGHQASAQLVDPQKLIDLVKKKKSQDPGKTKLPNLIPGKKPDGTRTAITPKVTPKIAPNVTQQKTAPGQNLIGKNVTGKNLSGKDLIGKGTDPKGPATAALPKGIDGKGINPKAGLGKGVDGKNAALGKGTDGKSATGPLGKAVDGKGTNGKNVLGKGTDGKGTSPKTVLGKATDPKGTNGKSLLGKGLDGKGPSAKSALTNRPLARVTQAPTPVERLRLRADHRRDLFTTRLRLPIRPLPGERGFTGVPPVGETRLVSTEMVFRVGPNVSPQALDAVARRHGLTTIGSQDVGLAGGRLYHFRLAGGRQVADVIRALEAENVGVPSANYVYRLFQEGEPREPQEPQDPQAATETDLAAQQRGAQSEQYVVDKFGLGDLHKVATGSGVLVAVIDSAIDVNHPDLFGAVVDQFDAIGRREKPHYHGTGMVGAIAAHSRLTGIAPGAKILAVHAFSTTSRQSPEATTRQILAGLDWAISKGARVINMSFAGPHDPMLQLAIKNAHTKGVVLIAAAGNSGPRSPPLYPAADRNVIAVTATDENDRLFAQAVRGPHLAVAAPGVDVMVPAPGETYQLTTGTSVAAAHVSGVAALLIERYPSVDAATVLEVLTSTARTLSSNGRDDQFGWGLIDPAAALAELESRMADGKIASATRPPGPKQPAPKQQATPRQGAPRLTPASAQ